MFSFLFYFDKWPLFFFAPLLLKPRTGSGRITFPLKNGVGSLTNKTINFACLGVPYLRLNSDQYISFKLSFSLVNPWKLFCYLIDHEFYPLLAMVYKCLNIYLLLYRVYLEYLQVQVLSGEIWWFWSLLRCRTAQTCQISSNRWRPFSHNIKLTFWHKI